MSGLQLVSGLSAIEKSFGIKLGHVSGGEVGRKVEEYGQFDKSIRVEAASMSELYEVFYCLENSIRKLISDVMFDADGAGWWDGDRVDAKRIREPAAARRKKEVDSGITPRSDRLIEYTTFGELSQLITDNWELFDPIFSSKSAVSNISNQLNLLRGPIAHCNPTDDIEHERLNLAVRSWFRIMS
ncbi:Swt1 family HEPN domain-containing protein [uncultured Maricaulis sp.]|uniref:Swt1 family HEPN domain-containing protein n=1 Tax=uncultured Maricaulis sp. TaxID=174710 RepID=UPI00260F64F5|nr:Swt1 family HEPN domain-containing protein [uncultured Maricaulis sp.]